MDAAEALRAPAVLVFRERGGLLFANPVARALLGHPALAEEDLQGACARLFPGLKDRDRAASALRRALSGKGLWGDDSFQAEFLGGTGRGGLCCVISWRERDGESRAMLSISPSLESPRTSQAPSGQAMPLESMADLVERIHGLLDVAVTVGRVGSDEGGSGAGAQDLLRRLELARGVLMGLERGA